MNNVDPGQWNDQVAGCEGSRVYHLYQWGRLLQDTCGYPLFFLQREGGLFPLALVKSAIFGNRLVSLPFADYGGPCLNNLEAVTGLVQECQAIARQHKVDFIEVRCPAPQYSAIFEEAGFVRRNDYVTFVLGLEWDVEALWRGIGDKNRNMVRKAEKGGVQVVLAEDRAGMRSFYRLYRPTMKKRGSPPHPARFFDRMWELFYPDRLMVPLAMYRGECIAAGLFFRYGDTIHHAYSGSRKECLGLAPNDLIQWSMIKWGHEHGFRQLDFGRTRPDEGTVLFKKRWGGEAVAMPYYYKFYRRELKERQEVKYRWLSTLWARYLPAFLANRLGPWLVRQIG